MLELRDISISLKKSARPLIKKISFVLNKGDKVAIIGEEGNGKSTLLKLIYNEKLIEDYCDYTGQVVKKALKIGIS